MLKLMQRDSHHSTASQTSYEDNLLHCPTPAIIVSNKQSLNQSLNAYLNHTKVPKKKQIYSVVQKLT
jgi:hypothetical protein